MCGSVGLWVCGCGGLGCGGVVVEWGFLAAVGLSSSILLYCHVSIKINSNGFHMGSRCPSLLIFYFNISTYSISYTYYAYVTCSDCHTFKTDQDSGTREIPSRIPVRASFVRSHRYGFVWNVLIPFVPCVVL